MVEGLGWKERFWPELELHMSPPTRDTRMERQIKGEQLLIVGTRVGDNANWNFFEFALVVTESGSVDKTLA
jgi:hypothetical protein